MKSVFTTKSTKKTFHKVHKEKIFVCFVIIFVFFVVNLIWPQPNAEVYAFVQPSPRPTIDLTATALAQPTSPPGPTNTPLPPGPTSPPQSTNVQPSAVAPTATRVRAQATNTSPPTTEPPTVTRTPTATRTAPPTAIPPTQTPWVILITTTPQAGGGVVVITVIPTLQPTVIQPETPAPPKANWDWLGWLVLLLVLFLLAIPLLWLARRRFILPMLYPARGRPRATGMRPGRGRERRL